MHGIRPGMASASTAWHRFGRYFRPRIIDALHGYNRRKFAQDVLAGFSVGVIALPLSMAFAIASGLKPEQGIYTAIVAGVLISALGGTRYSIGGPAGAFIVVVYGIVEQYGVANLLICTMMAGAMMLGMGLLRLGSIVKFVPHPVIVGFTNGIAVLILLTQLRDFLGLQIAKMPAEFFALTNTILSSLHTMNPAALLLALVCLAAMLAWPLRWSLRMPAPVVILVIATLVTASAGLPVETIGDRFGGIPHGLPALALPDLSPENLRRLLGPAITIALLGALESLLCAVVADQATGDRHNPNQELMGQGIANLVAPLFGGFCATGTIARTSANIKNGAQTPVSGIVHACTLLIIVLFAAPLAVHVPLAALAAILVAVALRMGEWQAFVSLRQYPLPRNAIMLATFALTIVLDITTAVQVGMVCAVFILIRRMTQVTSIHDESAAHDRAHAGVRVLHVTGTLFFGTANLLDAVAPKPGDRVLVLNLTRVAYVDTTALNSLEQLCRRMRKEGRQLVLAAAQRQPLRLMLRSGLVHELGRENVKPSLDSARKHAAALAARTPASANA
jgi:sulfate permease, SulP family